MPPGVQGEVLVQVDGGEGVTGSWDEERFVVVLGKVTTRGWRERQGVRESIG